MSYTDRMKRASPNIVRLLTLNIASPSVEKAERQLVWLGARDDDVVVLTETGVGDGTRKVVNAYRSAGYDVAFESPPAGERGVMIASRLCGNVVSSLSLPQWSFRLGGIRASIGQQTIDVVGLYVPSRDASIEKTDRKARFLQLATRLLELGHRKKETVILGDMNVLEPSHEPAYRFFEDWEYEFYNVLAAIGCDAFRLKNRGAKEYSWVGRTGDGYRYDHAFVSGDMAPSVLHCDYNHETRERRLSDHSSLVLTLDAAVPVQRKPVTALMRQQTLLF